MALTLAQTEQLRRLVDRTQLQSQATGALKELALYLADIIDDVAVDVAAIKAAPFITKSATSALSNESVATAGTNITITHGVGTSTFAASGGGGGSPDLDGGDAFSVYGGIPVIDGGAA